MNVYMTATQGRKNFYALLRLIQKPDTTVIIIHEGRPKGVFLSFEQFEGWLETMDIMADRELASGLVDDIRKAQEGSLDVVPYETVRKNL